jgi:integrase
MAKKLKGFRAIKTGNKTHYYFIINKRIKGKNKQKLIALGSIYHQALIKYAEIINDNKIKNSNITFNLAVNKYVLDELPKKQARTQKDYNYYLTKLLAFFDNAPLNEIRPMYIRQYLDIEGKKSFSQANKHIQLFSSIFNYARSIGYTDAQNPCAGIKKHKVKSRDIYIDDNSYFKILEYCPDWLSFFIQLAYLTGQRPADVMKFQWSDINVDGEGNQYLHCVQNKTNKKLNICIIGQLKTLLDTIKNYQLHNFNSAYIACGLRGLALTEAKIKKPFARAKEMAGVDKEIQIRDLRAKAGTDKADKGGIEEARKQLGHTSIKMTNTYVRPVLGDKVDPTA